MAFGEAQGASGDVAPPACGGFSARVGELWFWQGAFEYLVEGEFAGEGVGGDAGDVADFSVDLEAALFGFLGPVLHIIEVAVDEVDAHAVDGEPGAAVGD